MPCAYYNDFAQFPCQWMRELISAEYITAGEVFHGDIANVTPEQISGFDRVHLFAGIAGWDVALTLAGWPESVPVMTGSCPCQPFSRANRVKSVNSSQNKGIGSERDIWPEMHRLIRTTKIPFVFGEQVEDAISYGWMDRLEADLAHEGYTTGFSVLGAHSVGAPHKRHRLYWVAYARGSRFALREAMGREVGSGATLNFGSENLRSGVSNSRYSPKSTRRLLCADGKYRRIPLEPEFYPVATGVPSHGVEIVRGAGNAIHVETAAGFVRACLDALIESD